MITAIQEHKAPLDFQPKIVEGSSKSRPGVLLTLEGRVQNSDLKNGNRRVYPRSVWEKSLTRPDVQERIKNRRMVGELDHPESGATSYTRVSHVMTEVNLRNDGEVYGKLDVLDTPPGRVLETLAKAGVTVGISSRGDGSTRSGDDGLTIVEDDFVPETWDIVVNPSTHGAFVGLSESVRKERDGKIIGAISALVNGTSEKTAEGLNVLFESFKIISELDDKTPEGPYKSLRESLSAKLKSGLGECGCKVETKQPSQTTPIIQENHMLTEEQHREVARMVEAQRAAIAETYRVENERNQTTIRNQADQNVMLERRLRAAESIIETAVAQNRVLKEKVSTTPSPDNSRVAKLETELSAAKALMEAMMKAIDKLKGTSKKVEAAERVTAALIEHIRTARRHLHIEKLVAGDPNATELRKILESQPSIKAINESYSGMQKIAGIPGSAREPLPVRGNAAPGGRLLEMQVRPPAGQQKGDVVSNRLISRIGGV